MRRREFLGATSTIAMAQFLRADEVGSSTAAQHKIALPSIAPGMRFLSLAWSKDGSLLALHRQGPHETLVFNTRTGELSRTINDPAVVTRMFFRGTTRNLILFQHDGKIREYDWSKDSMEEVASSSRIWTGDVSPDGALLAVSVGVDRPTIDVIEIDTRKKLYDVKSARDAQSRALGFSPDSKWLAVGTDKGALAVYAAKSGRLKRHLRIPVPTEPNGTIGSLAFSADSRTLTTVGDRPAAVTWWDFLDERNETTTTTDRSLAHLSVAASPDGKELAVGLANGLLVIYDAESRRVKTWLDSHETDVYRVGYSPDSAYLYSISARQKLAFTRRN
jgi:WD40 repeat protein